MNRDRVIQLRVTEEEQMRYKALSASEGLGLSEWVRKNCEGVRTPPIALQGHSGGKKQTLEEAAGRGDSEGQRDTVVHGRPVAVSSSVCSRTGFPVEVCLCPKCKSASR